MTDDRDRVARRAAELPPEEQGLTDDPEAQAEAILAESDERQADRNAAPSTHLEHRRSEDTVDPT